MVFPTLCEPSPALTKSFLAGEKVTIAQGSNMCSYVNKSYFRLFCWIVISLVLQCQHEIKCAEVSSTTVSAKVSTKVDSDISAPLEVLVEKTTSNSISLIWKPPPDPKIGNLKLFTYSLTLTPLGQGLEKEFSLPPMVTSKEVTGLAENTRYAVQLSAVYGDPTDMTARDKHKRVSAPKFTVFVPPDFQQDIPVGDDGLPSGEPACNCSDTGMVACTRRPGFMECTCQPGYTGEWCELCAPGNFRAGKECVVCPCSNVTSTAECKIDESGQVSCKDCLPGHRGSLCTSCSAGYRWREDRCIPLDCLSSSLCIENRNAPGCEECLFLENHFPTAHRSNSDRSIADGTLPLIAVIVTLGVLLLVAAMATCYRYWDYHRHQPRIPFWSIELQDDKSDLHSHCQYQHLDAATNKPREQTEVAEPLNTDSVRRTYNTMNV